MFESTVGLLEVVCLRPSSIGWESTTPKRKIAEMAHDWAAGSRSALEQPRGG